MEQIIHVPLPAGYLEIGDVIKKREADPRRAAALARARQRLATQVTEASGKPTLGSLRLKSGLSQSKLAELIGNSQSSYSLIESGRRTDIYHSTFEKLTQILNVSRDELAEALKNTQEQKS